MSEDFLNGTAYRCALIPAAISFSLAAIAIVFTILVSDRLTFLRRLDMLYCTADMVQSATWFFGPKFTSSSEKCAMQEYFFQGSILLKGVICTVIVGLMSYVIQKRRMPDPNFIYWPTTLTFVSAVIFLILSVSLDSSSVVCKGDLVKHSTRVASNAKYLFCFILPLLGYCFVSVVLSFPSIRSIREDLGAPSLRSLVDKARTYFVLLLLMMIPTLVFFISHYHRPTI